MWVTNRSELNESSRPIRQRTILFFISIRLIAMCVLPQISSPEKRKLTPSSMCSSHSTDEKDKNKTLKSAYILLTFWGQRIVKFTIFTQPPTHPLPEPFSIEIFLATIPLNWATVNWIRVCASSGRTLDELRLVFVHIFVGQSENVTESVATANDQQTEHFAESCDG